MSIKMGRFIFVNEKDFVEKFIGEMNYNDFRYILISDYLDNSSPKKHRNIIKLDALYPPVHVLETALEYGYGKRFKKAYSNFLDRIEARAILIKVLELVTNGQDVCVMCSESEEEFHYIDFLRRYIDNEYGIKLVPYLTYRQDPEFYDNYYEPEELEVIEDKVTDMLNQVSYYARDIDLEQKTKSECVRDTLELLDFTDIKRYATQNDILVKSSDTKETLIKRIVKRVRD